MCPQPGPEILLTNRALNPARTWWQIKPRAPAAQLQGLFGGSGYTNLSFPQLRTVCGAGCYFGCCKKSWEGAALQVLAVSLGKQDAVPAALSCAGLAEGRGAGQELCL